MAQLFHFRIHEKSLTCASAIKHWFSNVGDQNEYDSSVKCNGRYFRYTTSILWCGWYGLDHAANLALKWKLKFLELNVILMKINLVQWIHDNKFTYGYSSLEITLISVAVCTKLVVLKGVQLTMQRNNYLYCHFKLRFCAVAVHLFDS